MKELYGKNAIDFVKRHVANNLPQAELVNEYAQSGYWGIKYLYQGAYFSLDSDRGSLHCAITIDNKEFPLWQFDREANNAMSSDDKSIVLILDILKRFFE